MNQTEKDFRADLRALLDKYNAEIEAVDHSDDHHSNGDYIRIEVNIPAIWDGYGRCHREYALVDFGHYVDCNTLDKEN